MTIKLGLMGANIGRSKMSKLQLFLADLAGIDMQYKLIDGGLIDNFEPVAHIHTLIDRGYDGINVTHPYKQTIYPAVSKPIIEDHKKLGSYNTLKFNQNGIYGANTDYSGFKRAFQFNLDGVSPGNVLVCGAGGVGRAVTFALGELNATHIYLADISDKQSAQLADTLAQHNISASSVPLAHVPTLMTEVDGLVNCTALGMFYKPGSAFPERFIGSQKWAFDAVYTPLNTNFMTQCKQSHLTCLSGFDLWLFQGLDAFYHFTGIELDVSPDLISTALSWQE